ncbi:MAG: flagellar hook-associated protein FlgL [Sedimentisphaerales bacterium]|jgi:flagellar hook-associated protein 3 FlgL
MSGMLDITYNNVTYALYRYTSKLTQLQEEASTGSKINRVSDDPSDAYRVLTLQNEESSLKNYSDKLADMCNTLDTSSSIVQSMASTINTAKVDITQVTSGTYDQSSRDSTASAINDLLGQLVQMANTQYDGQYLFGGNNTSSAPFVAKYDSSGNITSVTYQGSQQDRTVEVAPGVSASAYINGDDLFSSNDRGTPVFTSTTGAAAGSGTSSVTGSVWLTVSADDDGNYKLSIDDGASWVSVPPGGDDNLAVTDSRTGKVLYVNTKGITATGTDLVRVPGTQNAFNALIDIRDMLKNDKGLSNSQLSDLRDSLSNSLDEVSSLLMSKESTLGSKSSFLNNLKTSLDSLNTTNSDEVDSIKQADVAQVSVDLSRYQNLYQMSLAVAGKLLSVSLLDYIQ